MYLFVILLSFLTISANFANPMDISNGKTKFRTVRDLSFGWFRRQTTTTLPPVTLPPKLPHNLDIGVCEEGDRIIYIDETKVESNNATISGVIEIYIDSPYSITCAKITDLVPDGNGAIPTYNSGGRGENYIFINVQGVYGFGMHFRIVVRGSIKKTTDDTETNRI